MWLRSLAERLSRGVVLRRRLPAEFGRGRLYVSPESGGLRYWRWDLRRVDSGLFALVDELVKPAMRVWDIGANVGLFAFAAASRAGASGAVLAVEPDIENANLLLRSRRATDPRTSAAVEILPVALGAPGPRVARFEIASRSRSSNSLVGYGLSQRGECREVRAVPLYTADELLLEYGKPDVVKIDVEGAETALLQGARRLLAEARPALVIEVELANSESVAALLKPYRYRIFDGDKPIAERRELDRAPWNCVALPS